MEPKETTPKIFTAEYFKQIEWEALAGNALRIVLILFIAWVIQIVARKLLAQMEAHLIREKIAEGEPPSESQKRIQTLVRLIRQGVSLGIWIVFILIILGQLDIRIGPILAGAGIAGLAVGFGAQNLVRDVISGFFLILENQVRVGDIAVINGTAGLVERINFRTLVLRDVSGIVHVFPNGTIDTLSNMTNEWSAYVFDIGVAYKENTDNVCSAIQDVGTGMRNDEVWGPQIPEDVEVFGVNSFDDSAVVIKGRIKTIPSRQWAVGREFLRRVKLTFDERGIEFPFPQRTLSLAPGTAKDVALAYMHAKAKQAESSR